MSGLLPWRRRVAATLAGCGLVLAASAAPALAAAEAPTKAPAAGPRERTASVSPFVDCLWDNGNGTFSAVLGYTSTNAGNVTIPVGANNYVTPNPANRGQTTVFVPGTHHNAWVGTDSNPNANWIVQGNGVSFSENQQMCPTKPVPVFGNAAAVLAALGVTAACAVLVRRRTALA